MARGNSVTTRSTPGHVRSGPAPSENRRSRPWARARRSSAPPRAADSTAACDTRTRRPGRHCGSCRPRSGPRSAPPRRRALRGAARRTRGTARSGAGASGTRRRRRRARRRTRCPRPRTCDGQGAGRDDTPAHERIDRGEVRRVGRALLHQRAKLLDRHFHSVLVPIRCVVAGRRVAVRGRVAVCHVAVRGRVVVERHRLRASTRRTALQYGGSTVGSLNCRTAQAFAPMGAQKAREALLPGCRQLCGSLRPGRLPKEHSRNC